MAQFRIFETKEADTTEQVTESNSILIPEFDFNVDSKPTYSYYVHSRNRKSTSLSQLKSANTLSDFIEDYPNSWVASYDSVMVFATSKGRQVRAPGSSEQLTSKQKEILSKADMFSEVVVYVKYKTTNSVTHNQDNGEMTLQLQVQPEVVATYPGGEEGLQDYLRESSEKTVNGISTKDGFVAIVYFTINEYGKPEDITISESLAYKGVDVVLLEVLQNMPAWNPAKDIEGNRVKQKFEFVFGYGREGGC